ncbi:hypothetical protein SCE1572_13200 [Sorangium cellulosum So0157-2]|uniref:Uncharacterized protein n=1 Tax=Sorangium cellulosum So0157-2 TaxID=1254432 RepID=S4XSN6_SORCE|nr:hypothetical protein SCE1572_13200 [Sorangium cellulosum So0157-2]
MYFILPDSTPVPNLWATRTRRPMWFVTGVWSCTLSVCS